MPIKVKSAEGKMLPSDKVLHELRRQHGEAIGGRGMVLAPVARIPFGIFPLDLATGGGIPRGRVSILYGLESSGKSLNLYMAMANVQRQGQTAVLVDTEHAWDTAWGKLIGVDTEQLIVVQPDNAEQAVDAIEAFMYAKDVGIVGLDSVSALTTENEIKSGAEKMIVAGSAAITTKMCRKVGVALSREAKLDHHPALVVVSQTRMKVGVMFGDPETISGGNALRFMSSLTLRFYGKNKIVEAINKTRPAFKFVQGTLKKYRCPIVSVSFEYDQCLLPHEGLSVGQVSAWNTVEAYLKTQGKLTKSKAGWTLFGSDYKTLDLVKARYRSDRAFAMQCETSVTEKVDVISIITSNTKIDKETGEITDDESTF